MRPRPSFDVAIADEIVFRARIPDRERMIQAYHQSTATINLLRSLAGGGFLDLNRIHDINLQVHKSCALFWAFILIFDFFSYSLSMRHLKGSAS